MVERFTIHVATASWAGRETELGARVRSVLDDPVHAVSGCEIAVRAVHGWVTLVVAHPPVNLERQAELMRLAADAIGGDRSA